MESGGTIVILANGTWAADEARPICRGARHIVAADGGWDRAFAADIRPDVLIGDLDSLPEPSVSAAEASGASIFRYPREKDETDLDLALGWALHAHPERVVIYGALGGRADHSITNLHLLERCDGSGVDAYLVSAGETIRLVTRAFEFADVRTGDRVSLIPLSDSVRVTTCGLRYGLCDEVLWRAASRGVSNVVTEPPVRVSVSEGKLLVVHARGEVGE